MQSATCHPGASKPSSGSLIAWENEILKKGFRMKERTVVRRKRRGVAMRFSGVGIPQGNSVFTISVMKLRSTAFSRWRCQLKQF